MNGNMNFGVALEYLKRGALISRHGWNGKDMHLMLVKGQVVTDSVNAEMNREIGEIGLPDLPVLDAVYMKTADNKLVPWLASQTDILSEDWFVI